LIALVILYAATKDRWRWKTFVRRTAFGALGLIVLAALGAGAVFVWNNRPVSQQTEYGGLTIGISPDEVIYRKGSPPAVMDELSNEPGYEGWQKLIEAANVEKGKTVKDYNEWSYQEGRNRLDVTFNKERTALIAVSCFSSDRASRCPTIEGINDGDSEDQVLRKFGSPDSSKLEGVTKTLYYSKIGVSFTLEKQHVYMLGINDPRWIKK
jgi:hypothetical protein